MKYKKHTFPWDHWTMEDVLPDDIARRCFNACTTERAAPYPFGKRANYEYNKRKWVSSSSWHKMLDKDFLKPILLPFLTTECKDYITLDKADKWRAEWVADPPGFHLDTHPDIPEKKLSAMIYLGYKKTEGTSLYGYGKDKGKSKHIPSGFNVGMLFFPNKKTLHGFPRDRAVNNYRYAFLLNIVDKTFKEEPSWPVTF